MIEETCSFILLVSLSPVSPLSSTHEQRVVHHGHGNRRWQDVCRLRLLARALREAGKRVGVYKPVASGCEILRREARFAGCGCLVESGGQARNARAVCPQLFAAPLAPHLAARAEGRRVDRGNLRERNRILAGKRVISCSSKAPVA